MKAFRQIIGVSDQRVEEDELDTEINSSRNAGLLRGVKRRCLKSGWEEKDVDTGAGAQGRSFLETKWESEVRRKRECLASTSSENGFVWSSADLHCR